jgi:hypothetical protein
MGAIEPGCAGAGANRAADSLHGGEIVQRQLLLETGGT